jgi:hypothetical protein
LLKRRLFAVAAAGTLVVAFAQTIPAHAENPVPKPLTHTEFGSHILAAVDPAAGGGVSQYKNGPNPICTQTQADGAVHRTDCEGNAPDNETSIAVDPTNPNVLLAAGNDYQLRLSPGGSINETVFTRPQVSSDGGATWVSHPIKYSGYTATGDPAVAIDADGTQYVATLGFGFPQGVSSTAKNTDVLVSHSTDHGATWSSPSRVASGTGQFNGPGIFNDKEMIAAWGHGNAIVTYSVFLQGQKGSYIQSPIYATVTHDGGNTWTSGVQIDGSASFCSGTGPGGPNDCNNSQGSWPVVAADGSVYVYFFTTDPTSPDGDDQLLVVKVDPQTGQRVAGPYRVSGVQDGINDYPVSVFGDLTLHDSQFRAPAFGNIAADPTNPQHLAVVWSDMRNSPSLEGNDFANGVVQSPYTTATNSDVMLSESKDGGVTWSTPTPVGQSTTNDQWFGSAAFLSDGRLVVGMMDRSGDVANDSYTYTLSVRTGGSWKTQNVSGAASDPTKNNRWFTGGLVLPGFPFPTSFIGDYTTIAVSGTTVHPLWTDLRNQTSFGSRTGADEQLMTTSVGY